MIVNSMNIRRASLADARAVSELILGLSTPFFVQSDRAGAEPFLAAISESAVQGYISATNFQYFIAESGHELVGVVALRDNSHLYHLFVAEQFQGQGLARELWNFAKSLADHAGNPGMYTVNSSLNAVQVYDRFGFRVNGPEVQMHGVAFQPMQLLDSKMSGI